MKTQKKPVSLPEKWLRLKCCPTGKHVVAKWLKRGPDGKSEICRDQESSTSCAWVLETPEALFMGRTVILIKFCPGCGTPTPGLQKKVNPTYHPANYDRDAHCLTCGTRYCAGQDPAHVYEVWPSPDGALKG